MLWFVLIIKISKFTIFYFLLKNEKKISYDISLGGRWNRWLNKAFNWLIFL